MSSFDVQTVSSPSILEPGVNHFWRICTSTDEKQLNQYLELADQHAQKESDGRQVESRIQQQFMPQFAAARALTKVDLYGLSTKRYWLLAAMRYSDRFFQLITRNLNQYQYDYARFVMSKYHAEVYVFLLPTAMPQYYAPEDMAEYICKLGMLMTPTTS